MGGRWPERLPVLARILPVLPDGLLAGMAALVPARAGLVALLLPGWMIRVVPGLALLAVAGNAATLSAAERRVRLPVTLLMPGCLCSVALS